MTQEHDTDHRIQAILASGIKIPPMPETLLRLNALLRDADAGPTELAALIRDDGALSGAVFRVVGSPVFGLRTKVDSLPRAISLLGMSNTGALLRTETLRAALNDPLHTKALEHLWNRSAQIAALCIVAVKKARLRDINADVAFMLGMFHDCGLALLCKRFPAYAEALAESATWPDIPALDASQQVSHAVMGQMVAKNWGLSDELILAIRHHHELGGGIETIAADLNEKALRLCAVLNFAIHMYGQQNTLDDQAWETGWRDETARRLLMDPSTLAEWESEVRSANDDD